MIPNRFIHKRYRCLQSIMLEINKRCYMNKKDDFFKLKKCIQDYYEKVKKYY